MKTSKAVPIQLIVGLGNPGAQYAATRHNVGIWFVERIAESTSTPLLMQNKLKGQSGRATFGEHTAWLFIPSTFMNESGQAVRAIAQFYKIPPEAILVVHDELDFIPGQIRLKQGGGHGGHNGLRDIISHLGSNNFNRVRIGIGHPGDRTQVHNYVLHNPSNHDRQRINDGIDSLLPFVSDMVAGDIQSTMKNLHTQE